MVDLVRVDAARQHVVFHLRARQDAVIAHDLGIGAEKQRVVGDELVEQRPVFRIDVVLHVELLAYLRRNHAPPWAVA
ncbi:hypothetical protein HR51_00010 [Burkholderia cepacia]|nr:hypothetical protein HR51_00010 [Burkholderia cepacia]